MVKLSEIEVGKEFYFEYGPINRETIKNYGLASGDKNPIHMNDDFATNVGKLNGVIAHGMLSFGIMIRFLSDLVGDGKIIKVGGEMRGMVRPGDTYHIKYIVKEINGNQVKFDIIEESKTKIRIEKDGQIIKKFEAEERGWISEKDIKRNLIHKEETPEGTLVYRQRLAIPGWAIVELVD
ncbi:MAG: MaoC family dehydratase [Promethearchaeota archaeon]